MPPRPEYSPVPTVAPQGPRDPSELVHINFPAVHFTNAVGEALAQSGKGLQTLGGATHLVGQALDNAGGQLEHTGNQLWQRAVGLQELQLETDVKKREIEYETWLGQKNADYAQLQGEGASEATLKAHIKEVEEKRNKMSQGLPPVGQKMWDKATSGSMVSSIKGAAAHAAAETRKAALGASDARVDIKTDQFSKEDDVQRSEQLFKEARDEFFNTKVPLHGWTRDQAENEWTKQASKMYASKITRYAGQDAARAWDMLQDNRELMTKEDFTRVTETVTTQARLQFSRNISKSIQDENPDASYESKRDKVEKKVNEIQEKTGIKDPLLLETTEQRLSAEHSRYKKEQLEEYQKNQNTAKDAAWGYSGPGGRKPQTPEEFFAIPGAKEAYDALKPNDRHVIDSILLDNLKKGDDYPATPDTKRRVDTLRGEARSLNPEDRENFMLRNFREEKIPVDDQNRLYELQRKMREDVYKEDPHLTKGYRAITLPSNMTGANSSSTARKEFNGAFYNAIQQKLEEKKGVPLTTDEYREIAQQLLREMPGTGWFGSDVFQKRMYQTFTPSSEEMNAMKNRMPWASDAYLTDMYQRERWNEESRKYEALKTLGAKPKPDFKTIAPSPGSRPSVPTSQ